MSSPSKPDPDVSHGPAVTNKAFNAEALKDEVLNNREVTDNNQVLDNQVCNNNSSGTEFPSPYSKPVELIRQQEYPHMNQGPSLLFPP
jgi:hypothetical protein